MKMKILELLQNKEETKAKINCLSLSVESVAIRTKLFAELFAIQNELNLYSDLEIKNAQYADKYKEVRKADIKNDEYELKEVPNEGHLFRMLILYWMLGKDRKQYQFLLLAIAVINSTETKLVKKENI